LSDVKDPTLSRDNRLTDVGNVVSFTSRLHSTPQKYYLFLNVTISGLVEGAYSHYSLLPVFLRPPFSSPCLKHPAPFRPPFFHTSPCYNWFSPNFQLGRVSESSFPRNTRPFFPTKRRSHSQNPETISETKENMVINPNWASSQARSWCEDKYLVSSDMNISLSNIFPQPLL
jgi:hypothetical protein